MKRPMTSLVLLTLVVVSVLGCASSAVQLKPDFWNRKGARVGVAMATLPAAHAHRTGDEGAFLAAAINKGMNERLESRMRVIAPKLLGSVTDSFVTRLDRQGFDAKKIEEQIPLSAFSKFKGGDKGKRYFAQDLRSLSQKHKVDLLVLITVTRYGTLREYSPLLAMIPVGAPKALFEVRGQIIDLATNELLWQRLLNEEESTTVVDGEWSQPPDYPNLVAALEQAVRESMETLEREFFASAH